MLPSARLLGLATVLLAIPAPGWCQQPTVVPPQEVQAPQAGAPGRAAGAPSPAATVTQGVLALKRLGALPLDHDFPALQGRELRLRELTIAPGGSIALHRHDQRPGVAYILSGQMTERRGPGFAPRVIGPGEAAFEATGVTHWWRNEGSTTARALVVDIVPEGLP